MNVDDIRRELESQSDPAFRETQTRFGINTDQALGISTATLRQFASRIGTDHGLASDLWDTEIHECRILATMVSDPSVISAVQLERWVTDIQSWDLCDQACTNLIRNTPHATHLAIDWMDREEKFVKRAGYVLIATFAIHEDQMVNDQFADYLHTIATSIDGDDRHYVKKGASWAIREIGKRNPALRERAISTAKKLKASDSKPEQWVGKDVLRELDNKVA